ncbi:MAG: chromosomal replication initiator protein DnaA [Bacteroidetes bacterium]|nr:chromosomal replication initiator protein DnaA [Bacteroidota bacterium]
MTKDSRGKDPQNVWKKCLDIIKANISGDSFKTWFQPIKPVKITGNILTLQVPSQFFYEYLEEHYVGLLKKTIKKELGNDGRLEYSIIMDAYVKNDPYVIKVPASDRQTIKNAPVSMPYDVNRASIRNPFIIPGLKKVSIDPQLNHQYTFENFIEGDCNRLARAAGYAVAKNPGGTSFNPLFVYGGNGLGKTHLSHAIGIEVKKIFPDKTVLYVTSERFFNQFVEAVRNNAQNDFINFYQLIDVLIIDDVQFLSGKDKTQDVFFHVFNHLHQTRRQIILTSDKLPIELQGLEQRLISRFKWGLSADLQSPDLETRIAIIQNKLYLEGIEMPGDVIDHLAHHINTNVTDLLGALVSLIAQSTLNRKAITLDLAKQMVERYIKNSVKEVSIDYIQKVVCEYFDLPMDILKSQTRKREVVQARQLAMYFSKNMTRASLAAIGQLCGGKDHATVLHACRTVNNLIDTNKEFKNYVVELERLIKL